MTGSSLALIIVPIVAFLAGAFWLGVVFWADAHPGWQVHARAARHPATGAGPEPKPAIPAGQPAPAGERKAAA